MDYARGGGSSGARLSDGGMSGANSGNIASLGATATTGVQATLNDAGEHGAIVWQPFGDQGNRQGDCGWSCCDGAVGA